MVVEILFGNSTLTPLMEQFIQFILPLNDLYLRSVAADLSLTEPLGCLRECIPSGGQVARRFQILFFGVRGFFDFSLFFSFQWWRRFFLSVGWLVEYDFVISFRGNMELFWRFSLCLHEK